MVRNSTFENYYQLEHLKQFGEILVNFTNQIVLLSNKVKLAGRICNHFHLLLIQIRRSKILYIK